MKRLNKTVLALVTVGVLSSGVAQAALHDRGGGLLYDDVLNVTWLQDANYAKTSGYDSDGAMNWSAANTWAANLSFHDSVRNVDLTGWRLAANTPVGADWNEIFSYDGSTDVAFNITSPHSELSYMYYVNLGLKGYYSPAGIYQPNFGVFGNGNNGGQADVGPVKNLQSYFYWSGTAYVPEPADIAWDFFTGYGDLTGYQSATYHYNELYAWAVHPGDVAAVPEPETYGLLLVGLGLLGVVAKRRRRSFAAS